MNPGHIALAIFIAILAILLVLACAFPRVAYWYVRTSFYWLKRRFDRDGNIIEAREIQMEAGISGPSSQNMSTQTI